MGFVEHHAIVVTSWHEEHLKKAHSHAIFLDMCVSDIIDSKKNGYHSFLIGPDGSKSGWEDSDIGDKRREQWKQFVLAEKFYLEWVEANYGNDLDGGDCLSDTSYNYRNNEE